MKNTEKDLEMVRLLVESVIERHLSLKPKVIKIYRQYKDLKIPVHVAVDSIIKLGGV